LTKLTVTKRIKAADLPEFDAAQYVDSDAAVAAYLTDILEANDPALLRNGRCSTTNTWALSMWFVPHPVLPFRQDARRHRSTGIMFDKHNV
jgi:hypothetical protein